MATEMACYLCLKDFGRARQAHCPSCAQALLHPPRLLQAAALLSLDSSNTRAEAIVRPGNDGVLAALPQDADWDAITRGIQKDRVTRQQQQTQASTERLRSIQEKAEALKRQMVGYRDELDNQRQQNLVRRADLNKAKANLEGQQVAHIDPLAGVIRKTNHRLLKIRQRAGDSKAQLCYLASWLAGLKQETDHRRKPTGRILLGKLVVPDVRALNEMSGSDSSEIKLEQELQQMQTVNTCLDNICRLLGLWTHYLAISLPAEIILPHNDFPHSAIMPEKSSYRHADLQYPAQHGSPSASKLLDSQAPRVRLLHLDRPLTRLAKEDAKAFGLFVEGVMLLAWDVAYLARANGITSINTFDDVCNIGKNLWLIHRAAETRATQDTTKITKQPDMIIFGELSHGSARSLAGVEGAAMLGSWRLARPHGLIDKLRGFLLTEMTGAEWDVLSDRDLEDDEQPVLVGGTRRKRQDKGGMSVMSIMPIEKDDA